MIHSLRFTDGYPTNLPGVRRKTLRFNNRLNLIVGPNGAGKSTILRTLGLGAGCGEGGWSSERGAGEVHPDLGYRYELDWDGEAVFYQDCYSNSEHSFIDETYLETHPELRSTGERRIGLMNELIDDIEGRFLTYKMRRDERPSLVLDEVDNHLGFAGQAIVWNELMPKLSKKYQLIVSTHSVFPILLRRDNPLREDRLFDLGDRYAEFCVLKLGEAISFFNSTGDGAAEDEETE
jgi:predicted ATPase